MPSISPLAVALSAAFAFAAPSAFAAVNKEDRKLCADTKEDDPASLLRCIRSLNERLAEIEDEPDEAEAPDHTDAKIAALENELRAAKQEAATAAEAAKAATEQANAANVKVDALTEAANKVAALETAVAEAKSMATAASAKADRAGEAADIAIAKADAAAAKADAASRGEDGDSGEDGADGSRVKAPFSVVDDSGAEILTVEIEGSNAVLTLGPPDSYTGLIAGADGAGVISSVGERTVKMEVMEGTTAFTVVDPGEGSVAMGHIDDAFSGFIFSKGQAGVVNLGVTSGGNAAVRVFDPNGSGVFSAGSNPKHGGAGGILIGNGETNGVEVQTYSGGNGEIRVTGGNNAAAIALRGQEKSIQVISDSGVAVAELRPSTSGGGLINLATPSGTAVFYGGATTEGQGKACIIKDREICLGLGLPPVGGR